MSHLLENLRVRLFADGADLASMFRLAENPLIAGFTTNPTLMRKAGVTNYAAFAQEVLRAIPDRPISFEVISDEHAEMEEQAELLSSWSPNVYVKIPITNTRGESSGPLVRRLTSRGVRVNVTAVLTAEQAISVSHHIQGDCPAFISIFAGRIADTGREPGPIVSQVLDYVHARPNIRLIWASPRELLNVFQADALGCHIITATEDVLAKLPLVGKDLDEYSRETVSMFRRDALSAGLTLPTPTPA